jgi:hypothetical protein
MELLKRPSSLKALWKPAILNNGKTNDDLSVIVLTNLSGASPDAFIDELAGLFIPDMKEANGFGLSASAQP